MNKDKLIKISSLKNTSPSFSLNLILDDTIIETETLARA